VNTTKSSNKTQDGIVSQRLSEASCQQHFSDLHQPLTKYGALVEADRCYYCYDAPCQTACPTGINVPSFIGMISQHNNHGAAGKILTENIMGGTCARACPVETLCEQACVRNHEDDGPVRIGMLQRYATDQASQDQVSFFTRAEPTGHSVAVVGAGPAGLACAHAMAVLGHDVVIYEAQAKAGGLNEYGLAAYKMVDDFAQKEVDMILSIGGIEIRHGVRIGTNLSLADLQARHEAVFIGTGLGQSRSLNLADEQAHGVENAIEYIHDLRQTERLSDLPVGRKVLVIGGGMTAIDIAAQSKLLGAEEVTIAYRRGQEHMNASDHEQAFALENGIRLVFWAQPIKLEVQSNALVGVEFASTQGDNFTLSADVVFKAIGQTLLPLEGNLSLTSGRIEVDTEQRCSVDGVWAGGDCIAGGEDLAVSAVQDGKVAAKSMHQWLVCGQNQTRQSEV
jgi:glutamate synthase (NADPH/NADH) small chain